MDEGVGEVDADDLFTVAGHFERGAAHGTAEIEPACHEVRREMGGGADGEIQRLAHSRWPRAVRG